MTDAGARRRPRCGTPGHVTYGEGAIRALPRVLEATGWRRVLLVTGRASFEACGASAVLPEAARTAEIEHWREFGANPDAEDLARGLSVLRAFDPDAVVAVGGGSPMDMAKLLCAFDREDGRGLEERIRSGEKIAERRRALMLVPTTSGSGSEATRFAVVYIGDQKFSIEGPALLPDEVLLDPKLAASGSPHQRATSGIDAVCQSIESLWAVGATEQSRRFARHALGLLLPNIEAFARSADPRAGRAMCLGSHLSGRAIDVSKTTAAHALSYGITKRWGVSHGHAVALSLGEFIERHADASPADLQPGVAPSVHRRAVGEILRRLGAADGREGRVRFRDLLSRIGLENRLSRVGATDQADRSALAAGVNAQRLGNNPVVFDSNGLASVLERIG